MRPGRATNRKRATPGRRSRRRAPNSSSSSHTSRGSFWLLWYRSCPPAPEISSTIPSRRLKCWKLWSCPFRTRRGASPHRAPQGRGVLLVAVLAGVQVRPVPEGDPARAAPAHPLLQPAALRRPVLEPRLRVQADELPSAGPERVVVPVRHQAGAPSSRGRSPGRGWASRDCPGVGAAMESKRPTRLVVVARTPPACRRRRRRRGRASGRACRGRSSPPPAGRCRCRRLRRRPPTPPRTAWSASVPPASCRLPRGGAVVAAASGQQGRGRARPRRAARWGRRSSGAAPAMECVGSATGSGVTARRRARHRR